MFTKYNLKEKVIATGSYFFDRESMKHFGDTMKNYGLRSRNSFGVDIWELYRKTPVKNGLQTSCFFDKKSYRRIHSSQMM